MGRLNAIGRRRRSWSIPAPIGLRIGEKEADDGARDIAKPPSS